MSARDVFHEAVKQALIKDGWRNIEPMTLRYDLTKLEIDLAADRFFAAQKANTQIAVEVKSFGAPSVVYEFHQAIGQYVNYRMVLRRVQPERIPYLSLSVEVYERAFKSDFFRDSLEEHRVNLILVDALSQEIVTWMPKPE
ncbi:MAG: fatty-acid oxidation protein subunit alpha [Alkalinema sp. RU_4_3]|nr:fatty-acid oxidation protein subunit alpha [Alkalinema sp. RU_4_3]